MELKIDETDLEILGILSKNAKMRIHLIGKKLGIPSSTVHHRIKRLEKEGVIENWGIKKDYRLLGLKLKAHILVYVDVTSLKRLNKTQRDIAKKIKQMANVENVDIIVGDADLLVTIRAKDMEDLEKTLLDRIQRIEGITKTRTIIVVVEV